MIRTKALLRKHFANIPRYCLICFIIFWPVLSCSDQGVSTEPSPPNSIFFVEEFPEFLNQEPREHSKVVEQAETDPDGLGATLEDEHLVLYLNEDPEEGNICMTISIEIDSASIVGEYDIDEGNLSATNVVHFSETERTSLNTAVSGKVIIDNFTDLPSGVVEGRIVDFTFAHGVGPSEFTNHMFNGEFFLYFIE